MNEPRKDFVWFHAHVPSSRLKTAPGHRWASAYGTPYTAEGSSQALELLEQAVSLTRFWTLFSITKARTGTPGSVLDSDKSAGRTPQNSN